MIWQQVHFMEVQMKTVNINIQLDPIEDGVDWEQKEETKTANYGS